MSSVPPVHAGADGVVDVTCAGATKAAALAALSTVRVGGHPRAVAVLGNDLNDQEMLGLADISVLVGDGLPGLDRAGHVRRVRAADADVAAALRDVTSRIRQDRADG